MVEPQKTKVNAFASSVATEEAPECYRRLFLRARDGMLLVDAQTGGILDANQSFLDMVGLSLGEARSRTIWEMEEFQADLKRLAAEAEQGNRWFSVPVRLADKRTLELEVNCSALQCADRQMLQFICRDITERQLLLQRLSESQMRYRAIFDSTPVAMVLCSADGIVLDVNACLLKRFFRNQVTKEQLAGRHFLELGLCDLGDRGDEFMQFFKGVCVRLEEVPIPGSPYRPSGTANLRCLPLLKANGEADGGVIIIEDISEVREAQQAMTQSVKMAAVGQMTSGFAHEIGTPLGTISANAQYLLQQLSGGEGTEELRAILSETNRITNLIQQLLIFSRPARFRPSPTSVNDLASDVLSLMESQEIMRAVEVETDLSREVPLLPVEPTLIKQVFLNLVINACQAMPGGGRLTVISRVGRGGWDTPVAHTMADQDAGPMVEVSFTDTGVGISEADLRKIFTPFFTTKEVGKGTGLGLSVSYRIIQNHGGTITAESRGEGRGATFRVYLPVAGPPEATGKSAEQSAAPAVRRAAPWGGRKNGY
ncbi:hypothetical protein AMJ85_11410 [candidate division BRC1 bacterium SM23_51]|nr:MAG: hypothetical protein AMJ85_11410 [candidate division BRC1 bacterium SM23_51]